eukprot:TRINITY_DN4063_c0_g1_i3.p1 TRINITY_DN4063_c0_g1~~TRINITY_DN4063_c0_g1_i3.p1  ORF type:complete len:267 (+),score=34.20 TRINITY_DN4063_c0_g1_i3:80-880(+)
MIRRPPRSTLSSSSAASDVYKRQGINAEYGGFWLIMLPLALGLLLLLADGSEFCPAGSVRNGTGCTQCPLGKWAVEQFSQDECAPPAGAVTEPYCQAGEILLTTAAGTTCQPCPAGRFKPASGNHKGDNQEREESTATLSCEACAPGRFATSSGSHTCAACPEGRFQPDVAAKGCVDCALGHYGPTVGLSTCIQCPIGLYNNRTAQNACTPCAVGTVTDQLGTSLCANCSAGRYAFDEGHAECTCVACRAGVIAALGCAHEARSRS